MAGHPAEFSPDTDQRSVFILSYILIRAPVVRTDIKLVSEEVLPHVQFYFRFYMVCKETAFVIHVYYIYITITLRS